MRPHGPLECFCIQEYARLGLFGLVGYGIRRHCMTTMNRTGRHCTLPSILDPEHDTALARPLTGLLSCRAMFCKLDALDPVRDGSSTLIAVVNGRRHRSLLVMGIWRLM